VFMYELSQLIKYHESGGQSLVNSENGGANNSSAPQNANNGTLPRQSSITTSVATSKANRLLDFENISGIITALKSGYREIQDYPDTVVMRTIKFISKLGEIDVV